MRIDRWDSRRDGPLSETALRQKLEGHGYRVSTQAWAPGTILPAQIQSDDVAHGVISGIVKLTLDGETTILTGGDVVYMPRGAIRRVEVVGSAPAYCFEAAIRKDEGRAMGRT
jgi:quercetin dioxygenase-like cupin family protein